MFFMYVSIFVRNPIVSMGSNVNATSLRITVKRTTMLAVFAIAHRLITEKPIFTKESIEAVGREYSIRFF